MAYSTFITKLFGQKIIAHPIELLLETVVVEPQYGKLVRSRRVHHAHHDPLVHVQIAVAKVRWVVLKVLQKHDVVLVPDAEEQIGERHAVGEQAYVGVQVVHTVPCPQIEPIVHVHPSSELVMFQHGGGRIVPDAKDVE